MSEAETIARGLTKAQRDALLWMPGDGSLSLTRAHWTVSNQITWLRRRSPPLSEAVEVGRNGVSADLRHRLTPLGLAVRAILTERAPGGGS